MQFKNQRVALKDLRSKGYVSRIEAMKLYRIGYRFFKSNQDRLKPEIVKANGWDYKMYLKLSIEEILKEIDNARRQGQINRTNGPAPIKDSPPAKCKKFGTETTYQLCKCPKCERQYHANLFMFQPVRLLRKFCTSCESGISHYLETSPTEEINLW